MDYPYFGLIHQMRIEVLSDSVDRRLPALPARKSKNWRRSGLLDLSVIT